MKFDDIKTFFEEIDVLPACLNTSFGFVNDVKKFIESHIAVLENHPKNKYFTPFYERLKEVCIAIKQ